MKRRLAAFVLFSVLLAGGYSIGFVPTEKMQVKQMWGRGEFKLQVHHE